MNPETIFQEQINSSGSKEKFKQKKNSNPRRNFIVNGTPTPLSLNIFNVDNNTVLPKEEVNFTTASQVVSRDVNPLKEGEKSQSKADHMEGKENTKKVPLNDDLLRSLIEMNPDHYGQTQSKSGQLSGGAVTLITDENQDEYEGHNRKRSRRMDVKNSKILTFIMADNLTKDSGFDTSQRESKIGTRGSNSNLSTINEKKKEEEKKDKEKSKNPKKKDDKKKEEKVKSVKESDFVNIHENTVIEEELHHVYFAEAKDNTILDEDLLGIIFHV